MEETAFLAAVQGIVRRVHVQHDALRLLPVPVQEQVHQQGIQLRGVRHNLLVAFPGVQRRPRQLHPVQRALARRQSLPARPAPPPARRPRTAATRACSGATYRDRSNPRSPAPGPARAPPPAPPPDAASAAARGNPGNRRSAGRTAPSAAPAPAAAVRHHLSRAPHRQIDRRLAAFAGPQIPVVPWYTL